MLASSPKLPINIAWACTRGSDVRIVPNCSGGIPYLKTIFLLRYYISAINKIIKERPVNKKKTGQVRVRRNYLSMKTPKNQA